MKKLLLFTLFAILLASIAYADCYDSDAGPTDLDHPARYIGIDGFVTEGNDTYYDSCVIRKGGDETNESNWIREYYCDKDGDMDYIDYFCPSYHYKECLTVHKAAACDDYTGPADYNETVQNTTNTTAANQTINKTVPKNCGDKKVNFGEDCDPPGKECYTKGFLKGVCDFTCVCDSSLTPDLFKKLNATLNEDEEEKEIEDTKITFTVNETKEEIKINKTPKITGAAASDPLNQLIEEAKEPPEDFSDSFGIKITSAITDVVMKVWDLIMGIIGG